MMSGRTRRAVGSLGIAAGLLLASTLAADPAQAQNLRIGASNLPVTRGDPTTSLTYTYLYVWQSMFDALTTVDASGKPQPALAVSWQNTAPNTWQFRMRPGVTFHNGEPLTADAAANAVNTLITDEGKAKGGPVYGALRPLAGARKIDDMTVEIATTTPTPILMNDLAALRIAAPKAWASLGRDGFSRNPSGTGPFQQVSWDDSRAVLKRSDTAWRKAKLAGLEIIVLPELASRVQAFESSQVDLAWALASDMKARVERSGGKLQAGQTPSVNSIVIHAQKEGPTKDKRVRQALNYALNKDYTKSLLGGLTVSSSQPAARSVRGHQTDIKMYPHDPAKAKALLAEAGYPNGVPLAADITISNSKDVFEYVAADLAKIGAPLDIKVITLPDLLARRDGKKEFDGALFNYNYGGQPSNDMMRSLNAFHSCSFPRQWTCFPEIEPTIAAANGEFDEKKRDEALRKIALYYHENAPAIWLDEQVELDAVSARVKNYVNVNWVISYAEIELAR